MVLLALLAASLGLQSPQLPPLRVDVDVFNPAPVERAAVVALPVPLPRGALPAPPANGGREPVLAMTVTCGDAAPFAAPALPLLRWPDGSIALLHVHARVAVPARGSLAAHVEPQRDAAGRALAAPPAAHRSALTLPLSAWTELLDPWGRVLRADLVPDETAGPGGVLTDSGLVRVQRFRAAHRGVDGAVAGRALFDLRAYLRTVDGERGAELTLLLDNTEPLAGPIGPARLRGFKFCTADPRLRLLPAFAKENLLPPPTPRAGSGFEQWLLAPSEPEPDRRVPADPHYLGDGTAKTFRVHLFADADDLDDGARVAAQWAPLRMVALPALAAVRASGAWGAHGGPAPLLGSDQGFASSQLLAWQRVARYGPYGGFGEPENGGLTGAPRQGDSLLHNVLRWRSAELLTAAEGMVLQHTLRPSAGRRERLPDDTAAYRDGLQALAQAAPHGFTAPDYEHASAALLFDWYWLTGDALARDELARLGNGLLRVLAAVPMRTSRGEGACLEALVLCARATGDADLLAATAAHARTVLLPALAASPPYVALAQPSHPSVLDGRSSFDAPWQMALLVRGLAALHRATGDAELAAAAVRIADAIATTGWLEEVGTKTFVSATDVGRYSLAASPADRAGCDRMTIGAFELAAELATEPAIATRLRARSRFLVEREIPLGAGLPERSLAWAGPWLQIALDRQTKTQ